MNHRMTPIAALVLSLAAAGPALAHDPQESVGADGGYDATLRAMNAVSPPLATVELRTSQFVSADGGYDATEGVQFGANTRMLAQERQRDRLDHAEPDYRLAVIPPAPYGSALALSKAQAPHDAAPLAMTAEPAPTFVVGPVPPAPAADQPATAAEPAAAVADPAPGDQESPAPMPDNALPAMSNDERRPLVDDELKVVDDADAMPAGEVTEPTETTDPVESTEPTQAPSASTELKEPVESVESTAADVVSVETLVEELTRR